MAVDQASAGVLASAARDASPRQVARYLNSLKPILGSGTDARGVWVRFLNDMAKRDDLVAAHAEAQQMALGQGQNLDEARRMLASIPVPAGFEEMHRSIDRWLKALMDSCEGVYRSRPPLGTDTLAHARQLVFEAGVEADTFNRQRQTLVESLANRTVAPEARPRFIANGRELRGLVVGMVLAMLMVGGVVYGMMQITAVPAPTPPPKPTAAAPTRQIFPQPEVLGKLKNEINTRKVAFTDAEVQLVQPDLVIVRGKIQGPTGPVPVEATLQMSVTADNKPRVDARKLNAVGVQVPPEAFDALNKRVEEANKTLPDQVPPGQTLRKLYVENNAVVAELDLPAPAAPPPAKPGA